MKTPTPLGLKQVARTIRRAMDSCFDEAEPELVRLSSLLLDLAMSRDMDNDELSRKDVAILSTLADELENE